MDNNNVDIGKAIAAGLEVLSDPEIKVKADLIEDLVVLKGLLNTISSGKLVVASPDRILSQDVVEPEQKETIEEK
jgi:hypothetical protein